VVTQPNKGDQWFITKCQGIGGGERRKKGKGGGVTW